MWEVNWGIKTLILVLGLMAVILMVYYIYCCKVNVRKQHRLLRSGYKRRRRSKKHGNTHSHQHGSQHSNNNCLPLSQWMPTPECTCLTINRQHFHKFRISEDVPIPNQSKSISMANSNSTNWAGYVGAKSISKPVTGSCTLAAGTFNVPEIYTDVNLPNNNASIWTGIDGAFATDPTVQQIGIDGANVNGKTVWYAWFEMYPQPAYQIVGFPIKKGDSITTTIQVISTGQYQLTIMNNTRGVRTVIPTRYTKNTGAKQQSVEWIVEAPWMGKTLPLTHFSQVIFTKCSARISGVTSAINAFPNVAVDMVTPTLQLKAKTNALSSNGQSFSVDWKHY
jgi:hypothetical protein